MTTLPRGADQTFRARFPFILMTLGCLAIAAGAPVVHQVFPDYLPGYLIQILAIIVGFYYARSFSLANLYPQWNLRALLLLAYVVPLQNTFVPKALRKYIADGNPLLEITRPAIILLFGILVCTIWHRKTARPPLLIAASFIAGLLSWTISTANSDYVHVSLATGIFEFLCPFVALYVLSANSPDKSFLYHCLRLFVISFSLVALAQSFSILSAGCCDSLVGLPSLLDEFFELKRNVPLMTIAGGNGYGNPDNFVSLWVLIVPLCVGLYYYDRSRIWIAASLFVIYAGLLVYSRAGLLVILIGLIAIVLHRLIAQRTFSALPAGVVAFILASSAPQSSLAYIGDGVTSFINSAMYAVSSRGNAELRERLLKQERKKKDFDASGADRMEAIRRGLNIAIENSVTGTGYGTYPIIEPELTSPHNMFLQRFAEGGALGALSLLLMALYSVLAGATLILKRSTDIVAATCSIALTCFMMKAFVFGASFAIGGQIAWGFGVALTLAVLINRDTKHAV